MRGPRHRIRVLRIAAIAAVAALVAIGWLVLRPERPIDSVPIAAPDEPAVSSASPDATAADGASSEAPLVSSNSDPSIELPPSVQADAMRMPWGVVDLDAVREAMPDNLYWQTAAPTDDLRVQQEREDERARWNDEYGKVLSGTGTEDEIRAYFAHRHRLSADYVQFVSYLLDHYGEQLPERDVAMLELARKLHLARIEEIPRKTQEALDRKQAQDTAREAWQQEQADSDRANAE